MSLATTWQLNVRIEKGNEFAEYKDRMDISGNPTPELAMRCAVDLILKQRPHMAGGTITIAEAKKIR